MDREERACELHRSGCNCAQSILMAYADEAGLTEDSAYRLGTFFGGGMRRGEVCGAVAAALMILGLREGTPDNQANPKAARLMQAFRAEYGSLYCRELLDESGKKSKELCRVFIRFCVKYLEREHIS